MGIQERKEREKEQRRQTIIDAAETIFFSKGFDNATMDEVAEKAELSKGTIYLYFRSKEDLQFAIFMRGSDILVEMMKQRLREDQDGYTSLLVLAESFIAFSKDYRHYFDFFMHFETSKMDNLNIDRQYINRYLKEQSPLALVNRQVRKGMRDRSLRSDLPEEAFSATLWSQMLGVLMVLNNKASLYRIFDLNEDMIIRTHLELVSHGGRTKHIKNQR